MRRTLLLLLALLPAIAAAQDAPPPLRTVDHVDLDRYLGRWYEVAHIPNRFQKQCACCSSAEYALQEDGRLRVVNRCVKEDGELDQAGGVAEIVDRESNAKLRVSFVSFLGWRPFWGDYWIIGLDPDYRWAVVGTPDRKYGWVLSRTPALEAADRERVEAVLRDGGYALEAFVTDRQEASP